METRRCRTCQGSSGALRRGMCRACYLRAWRGTELPARAECALCPEKRRVVLRWTRVGTSRVVTCQNCGFLADKLRPRARDVAELRAHFRRERRLNDRRKSYVIDGDDPEERRVAPRRLRRRLPV